MGGAKFYPSGTTFNEPVKVDISFSEKPKNSTISVFCYDEENKIWDYVTEATMTGDKTATFDITHFSIYQCLDISPDMLNKYVEIVHSAQNEGKDDAWITSTYKDYLINEKHVMDYYEEFNGLFYEPCGVLISGNYDINGKSGDGNYLIERIGESNKVGNTYGLSKIGSQTVDYKSYKEENGKSSTDKETINVIVTVDYKIITPTIVLTSNKTELEKGESTTINVYCHYAKPTNTIYPDIVMPDYNLYIPIPKCYSIDKNGVKTDSQGRASFVVTALEDDAQETIKTVFEITGDQGTYAEGSITLNSCNKYSITGHVEEQFYMDFNVVTASNVVVDANGRFIATISYDYNAIVSVEDDIVTGTLSYTNVDISIFSTPSKAHMANYQGEIASYDVFKFIASKTPNSPAFSFVGTKGASDICILNSDDNLPLIKVVGKGRYEMQGMGGDLDYSIDITTGNKILLDFELVEGTDTYTSTTFKDSLFPGFYLRNEHISSNSMVLNVLSTSGSTTQTVTVSKYKNN